MRVCSSRSPSPPTAARRATPRSRSASISSASTWAGPWDTSTAAPRTAAPTLVSDDALAPRRSRALRRVSRGDRADAVRFGRRAARPRARERRAHLDPGRHAGRELPPREARARHRRPRRVRLPDPGGLRDRRGARVLRDPFDRPEPAAARGHGARGHAARPRRRARTRRARAAREPAALREHLPARAGRHLGGGSLARCSPRSPRSRRRA